MAWASIPPCSSRPGYFYGKLGHPVRVFLWAAAGKAKVCQPPLVLIGNILSPGGIWRSGFSPMQAASGQTGPLTPRSHP